MKQLITVVLILALSQSLLISSNVFPRDNIRNNLKNHEMVNGLKEKLKRHISKDELKSLRAQFEHFEHSKGLEPFIQKLRNGNDDPTPVIIEKAGYPSETHIVTTDDGYILEMHRIPHGKDGPNNTTEPRPVVFIQHGLLCSSADWVLSDPPKALAFIMSDAGYDVWLGNYRGNTYSRRHEHLDPDEYDYWRFTWDEMGKYDLPAMINKTLDTTGQEKVFYIGHSMGTTGFMVMSNMRPEMNDKIELANFLAPVGYMQHARTPLHYLAPFADEVDWILEHLFGMGEFLPSNLLMDILAEIVCDDDAIPELCGSVLFLLCGIDSEKLNTTLLDTIVHHTPAGASSKTLIHYGQEMASKNNYEFCMYDFGKKGNQEHYGQDTPPIYNMDKVTAPVACYWSENDWMAAPEDVIKLTSRLPNLYASYDVPFAKWNHLDHLWGIDADTLVYAEVLKNMEQIRIENNISKNKF